MEAMIENRNERDEQIFRARVAGISPRRLADQHGLNVDEINRIVSRRMVRIDNAYRAQCIALDIEALGEVQARVLKAALGGDLPAVHALLRLMERRSCALGLDSATRIDLTMVPAQQQTSTQRLRETIDQFMARTPPDPQQLAPVSE